MGFLNHQQYGSLSHDLPSRVQQCLGRGYVRFQEATFLGVQALISAGFSGLLSNNQLVKTSVILYSYLNYIIMNYDFMYVYTVYINIL